MTTPWVVAFAVLTVLVVVLAVAVLGLMRQVGVLHARIAPMGTHFAGEGLEVGATAPDIGVNYGRSPVTLVVFTSSTCTICKELKPSIDALRRQEVGLTVHTVGLEDQRSVFDAFNVRSTPYVVTVGADSLVLGRGVANSLEQIEELLRESRLDVQRSTTGA
jgi:thiol-disulfide isomerase/thioredoxin